MQIQKLPEKVREFVNGYFNLRVGKHVVRTPYFRNVKRVRAELRSLVGKGTPEEIEEEALIYAKLRGFSFEGATSDSIREFMQKEGIGIDCSGFIAHILNEWLKSEGKGHLSQRLKFTKAGLYRSFVRRLRPIENMGADLLTSELNTDKIRLKEVRVGDLLRLKGVDRGDHVAIISEIVKDDNGKLQKVVYLHSEERGEKENGVRYGEIEITDENKELKDQKWCELNSAGECWQFDRLVKDPEDTGLRRLKIFQKEN